MQNCRPLHLTVCLWTWQMSWPLPGDDANICSPGSLEWYVRRLPSSALHAMQALSVCVWAFTSILAVYVVCILLSLIDRVVVMHCFAIFCTYIHTCSVISTYVHICNHDLSFVGSCLHVVLLVFLLRGSIFETKVVEMFLIIAGHTYSLSLSLLLART